MLSFMWESPGPELKFKWPKPRDDNTWIPFKDILVTIEDPSPVGRSGRFYKIDKDTVRNVERAVAQRN